jgi:transcriptional regulator with XRE-family HTH domain
LAHNSNRLREERVKRNWRQQDVADKLGTTVVTVSRWEQGIQQPSAFYRIKLCKVFDKSAEELELLPAVSSSQPSRDMEVRTLPERSSLSPDFLDDSPDILPIIPSEPLPPPPIARAAARSYQNRTRMLRRLHRTYSELLEHSLQDALRLELDFTKLPDAVQNATNLLLHVREQPPQPLLLETSLLQAYEESQYELLILGAPGSGKSMLLLELAQQLVMQAQEEETYPLPVILPLSSWAQTRPPLEEWLITQLEQIYDIPTKLAKHWVQTEQIILPLLDGLDEMEAAALPACIAAINAYHCTYVAPLVVCSRYAEYEDAAKKERLHLQGALLVQPLSQEQVENYLGNVGTQATALRVALHHDVDLQQLVTTPLMLNVLILAYRGTPLHEIASLETLPAKQRQIFASYVQRMLNRQGNRARAAPEQTVRWLTYLAQQMREHNQTIFHLEHLQPDWLTPRDQRTYTWLGVRLPDILIGILVSLTLFILMDTLLQNASNIYTWITIVLGGLGGLLGVLFRGGAVGRASPSKEQAPRQGDYNCTQQGRHLLLLKQNMSGRPTHLAAAGVGVVVGLIVGLSVGLSEGLPDLGLSAGLSVGLSCVLISLLLNVEGIQLTERLHWTWGSLMRSLFAPAHTMITLVLTSLVTIIVGLSYCLRDLQLYDTDSIIQGMRVGSSIGLSAGLGVGLSYWILLGLFQGISSEQIDEQQRQVPDQGIRDSLRSSILMGGIGWGMLWLISTLSYGLSKWPYDIGPIDGFKMWLHDVWPQVLSWALSQGWILGLCGGLVVCLVSGGLAAWRHGILRLHLQRSGMLPLRCVRFFDEATSCILLQKVGGGYRFIHRQLLDYFAERESDMSGRSM